MRPLPDINNEAAMLERGRRSALGSARNEAAEALRDACTLVQSSQWDELEEAASSAIAAAERLKTLAAMWAEV